MIDRYMDTIQMLKCSSLLGSLLSSHYRKNNMAFLMARHTVNDLFDFLEIEIFIPQSYLLALFVAPGLGQAIKCLEWANFVDKKNSKIL